MVRILLGISLMIGLMAFTVLVPLLIRAHRHEVNDLRHPVWREKTGNQDVCLRPVDLLVSRPGPGGRNLEVPTLFVVQNRGKHAGRVEIRAAEPIDGTVHSHQRRCMHVPDDAVVLDRLISHSVPPIVDITVMKPRLPAHTWICSRYIG